MSIHYESRVIGEVAAQRLNANEAVGGTLLHFSLAWSLHPKREHVYTIFGTYVRVLVAIEGTTVYQMLGHALPEVAWSEESRDGVPYERPLTYHLFLHADQLLALEHARQGRGLVFQLAVRGNVNGPHGIRQLDDTLQLPLSVGDWLQALAQANATAVLLVGVPLPIEPTASVAHRAAELVRRAHEHLLHGDYDSAVGECRRAIESLWKARGLKQPALSARAALASGDQRRAMTLRDRRLAVGEALINLAHPAHHVEDEGRPEIFSRTDAALAVAGTAALISSFAVEPPEG